MEEKKNNSNKLFSPKEHALFLTGRQELNTSKTTLFAAIWSIIGLLIIFAPFYANIPKGFLEILCSILGAFILSSAAIGTINNYFLRQSQIDETKEVLKETFLTYQSDIEKFFFNNFKWVKSIDDSGLRKIHESFPRECIHSVFENSKNVKIRFLFLSYAVINEFEKCFRDAIENGCTIEIIVADPVDNVVIEFYENCEGYKKNRERNYAEMCISNLKRIKDNIDKEKTENFRFKTFKAPPSITCVLIDNWCCFGILWAHDESFHGPWFEANGGKSPIIKWIQAHIDAIITKENQ